DIASEDLSKATNYFYDNDIHIIRGDLITFDQCNNIAIFDGCQIINLDYNVESDGSLPDEFQVIVNKVPILYWRKIDDMLMTKAFRYGIIWFDHNLVKNQCLANIKRATNDLIFTSFLYEGVTYRMIYNYFVTEVLVAVESFKTILSHDEPIIFEYMG